MEFQTVVQIGYNYESSTIGRGFTRKDRDDQKQVYWTEKKHSI